MPEWKLSYDEGSRVCSIILSETWGPVVLDGRDKACVYDKLLNRNFRTVGINDEFTMWDCPTAPDGTDPDPLRPYEVRCEELVARLEAGGLTVEDPWDRCDTPVSNPYGRAGGPLPARDPDKPCNSQRFAAKNLYQIWIHAHGLKDTSRYDWRPC